MMALFDTFRFSRLKEGLSKTRDSLVGKLRETFSLKHRIDDEVLDRLEEVLLGADVGVATTTEIVRRIRERVKLEGYGDITHLDALLREEIQQLFKNGSSDEYVVTSVHLAPYVIMIVGVNGVGKTTTIGKLAHLFKSSGKNVLIAAADTFRAAANEQLEIWAKRAGVEIIQSGATAADPAAVTFDAFKAAIARKTDVMIIDTAGRLHTKMNLMEELKKIKRVLQKQNNQVPHEVLLVLDASIGQNAIQQAKQFGEAVGVTGLVVTKLDGTAKGGVVLAISRELNIPVRFIGVGEKIDDLQPFDGKAFVEALFA
jgi:fused signal recognition particle receptor